MILTVIIFCLLGQDASNSPAVSPEVIRHLQAGKDAENRKDLDAAIEEFRKATEIAPNLPAAFISLGDAFVRKRDYADAIAPLQRAVELDGRLDGAHQLLGYALLSQGFAAKAIPHLEQIHEYRALGIAQLEAGDFSGAVTSLQTAVAKTPDDPDLLYYLSRASLALSTDLSNKVLEKVPKSARARQLLGQNYFAARKLPEAIREYEEAVAMRGDLPGLRLELGQIYGANSEWSKAEQQFRQESQLQPGNAETAYRLGDALMQAGKMQEAIVELQRADELHANMPETLFALGRASSETNAALAEKSLLRVIEIERDSPLSAKAHFALATLYRKQGKAESANLQMQEFRRLNK